MGKMAFRFLRKKEESIHEWTRERMSAFIDGQLVPADVAELESHLRSCAECTDELRALTATRQLLRAMPMAHVPRSFTLVAAPRPAVLPRSFFWLRTATTLAAACFVMLL